MAKHVIILGAGASWTSGYPVATKLRVLLSSHDYLARYINDRLSHKRCARRLKSEFDLRATAVRLFREGAFATIDEFSFLAHRRFEKEVRDMKWWQALVFALHNPARPYPKPGTQGEEVTTGLEHSDYYPFVQKLFNEDFDALRDDIAVFTYNYDAYLDFVLSQAFRRRKEAVTGKAVGYERIPTALLSGMHNGDADGLLNSKGFCLLKLHGTSVLPTFPNQDLKPRAWTFNEAFGGQDQLLACLNAKIGSEESQRWFAWNRS